MKPPVMVWHKLRCIVLKLDSLAGAKHLADDQLAIENAPFPGPPEGPSAPRWFKTTSPNHWGMRMDQDGRGETRAKRAPMGHVMPTCSSSSMAGAWMAAMMAASARSAPANSNYAVMNELPCMTGLTCMVGIPPRPMPAYSSHQLG